MRGRAVVLSAVAVLVASFAFTASSLGAASYLPIGTFGSGGSGDGQFLDHSRITVQASTGYVFVADTGNDRVQVLEPSGTGLAYRATIGAGTLSDPFGVAIDPDTGDVYVSDAGNDRIVRFDSTYALDTTFAPAEIGSFAADLEFDAANDQLLVADPGNDLVHRLDTTGAHVSSFDGSSSGASFNNPRDIAIDPVSGDILVVDAGPDFFQENPDCCYVDGSSRVERFSADGSTHVGTIGPVAGAGLVAVDPSHGQVIVGDVVPSEPDGFESSFKVFDGATLVGSFGTQFGTITGIAVDGGASGRLYSATDRVHYTNFPDEGEESVRVFEAVAIVEDPPVVTIDPAGASEFAASFSGSVDPAGAATSWRFEYSVQGSGSWTQLPSGQLGAADPATPVSGEATGLTPDTAYEVRLSATNGAGTSTTAPVSFTTLFAAAPTATIDPPSLAGPITATFSGAVNPEGYATSWRFEYSVEGSGEWRSTQTQAAGAGTSAVSVEATVGGLEPNSDYLVRLVANSPAGSVTAGPESFATGASGPLVETRGVVRRVETEATLRAEVDPQNEPTTYYFEYGTSSGDYETTVPAGGEAIGAGSDPVSLLEQIAGLEPGATYYYRAVADNGVGGPVAGEERSFTTLSAPAPGPSRGYEMVSPPDKGGGEVVPAASLVQASVTGDKVTFTSPSAFTDAHASTVTGRYLSTRGGSGWTTEPITPQPKAPALVGALFNEPEFGTFTDDLSQVLLTAQAMPPEVPAQTRAFYRWTDEPRRLELVSIPESPLPLNLSRDDPQDRMVDINENLDRVVFQSRRRYVDAASEPGNINLYEYVDGQVRLVNILPDADHGSLNGMPAPYASVAGSGGNGVRNFRAAHEVSDDGSRIFFTTDLTGPMSGNARYGIEGRLYVRENGETTTWISKSQRSVPDPAGEQKAMFWAITPDGGTAFFTSAEKLTDDATASAPNSSDLYRYDVDTGALVDLTAGQSFDDVRSVLGSSADGSTVYFVAGESGDYSTDCETCGIYVWANGEITPVSTTVLSPQDGELFVGNEAHQLAFRVSATGDLAFKSRADITGAGYGPVAACVAAGAPPENCENLYFYDRATDEVTCISCPPGGEHPTSNASFRAPATVGTLGRFTEYAPRPFIDDGRTFVFHSREQLVSADVNEHSDVYAIDLDSGALQLISAGNGPYDAYFQDTGADGRDVFIWTRQPLVPGDIDEMGDLYDVRVGGGFPAAPEVAPCAGDLCQGPPGAPPGDRAPATGSLQGRGNLPAAKDGCDRFRKKAAVKLRRAKGASKQKAAKLRQQARQLKKQAKRCERGNGS